MKTRTKRYVMTVNKGNAKEERTLIGLRKMVTFLNKHLDQKFYVKCHGRFGKNNPNLYKYEYTSVTGTRINWGECRLEDAARLDVYIHPRLNQKRIEDWLVTKGH